ncbi:MAG: cupin domain-containing protein [SAR324 cluster bacterium]|nr:cupin domain-containing protein [SAR324 cluster bacterium]
MPSNFHFPITAAAQAPNAPGRLSPEILRRGELELRYYAPKGNDPQTPHTRDEVYVVASGSGTFVCDGESADFQAGDALFVPAHVEHRFEAFTEDFAVWVMFYGPEGGELVD